MSQTRSTATRKLDHVRINLDQPVTSGVSAGFDSLRFEHRALPEIDLGEIDMSLVLFGRRLAAPLLISSMTGGADGLGPINERLAEAAQSERIAMGVGSQRAALEAEELATSFQIRRFAPNVALFANLGAAQLNLGYGVEQCRAAVDMIEADALILHLNALQEAVQPEGDTRWAGILGRIEAVARELEVPIIAKEVGWGITGEVARQLVDAGVAAIDVAGAGGTSWSEVEKHRAASEVDREVAAAFVGWGTPTVECLRQIHELVPDAILFASGGIRDGVDVAKSIALGADAAGLAGQFLRAATVSTAEVELRIVALKRTLQAAMFALGAPDLASLRKAKLIVKHG